MKLKQHESKLKISRQERRYLAGSSFFAYRTTENRNYRHLLFFNYSYTSNAIVL